MIMKIQDLKMNEVQKLANEAVDLVATACNKSIVTNMIKRGIIRKEYIQKGGDVKFFVYSVDFIPNDDYECEEGFYVYGARGNFSAGLVVGPMSFVMVWDEKTNKFFLSEFVFENHPFSTTSKRIGVQTIANK